MDNYISIARKLAALMIWRRINLLPATGRLTWVRRSAGSTLLVAILAGVRVAHAQAPVSPEIANPSKARLRSSLLHQLDDSLQELAAKVAPAVVQIDVSGYRLVEDHEGNQTAKLARASVIGSGIIVDPDGYVMTNAHVVEGAQRIRVILPPTPVNSPLELQPVEARQILEATLVGANRESDIALLKVQGSHLPSLSVRPDIPVRQGELVFAIGSPEGLQDSITMGVVSSVTRQPDPDSQMVYIQADAPINHGNSGGPLVDIDGHVIGMNTLILSDSGGSEGLGFAIPAAILNFDYQSLRKYGRVEHVAIGARTQNITPTLAAGLNLERSWGAIVSNVVPLGNADKSGIQAGDIVLTIDGRPIRGVFDVTTALYIHPEDRAMKIDVLRGAQEMSFDVPVIVHHEPVDDFSNIPGLQKSFVPKLNIFATDLTEDVRKVLRPEQTFSGVAVVAEAASGLPVDAGLRKGDVIGAVNRTQVQNLEQLRTALRALKPGDPVVLQIERDGSLRYLAFEMQ